MPPLYLRGHERLPCFPDVPHADVWQEKERQFRQIGAPEGEMS